MTARKWGGCREIPDSVATESWLLTTRLFLPFYSFSPKSPESPIKTGSSPGLWPTWKRSTQTVIERHFYPHHWGHLGPGAKCALKGAEEESQEQPGTRLWGL